MPKQLLTFACLLLLICNSLISQATEPSLKVSDHEIKILQKKMHSIDATQQSQLINNKLLAVFNPTTNPEQLIKQSQQLELFSIKRKIYNFGVKEKQVWLMAKLENNSKQIINRALSNETPNIQTVDAFLIKDQKIVYQHTSGRSEQAKVETIHHRGASFELELAPQSSHILLIRLHSGMDLRARFKLNNFDNFVSLVQLKNVSLGYFYGALLLVALFNISRAFFMQDLESLFFSGYIIGGLINGFCIYGFGAVHVWPDNPSYNMRAECFGLLLYLLSTTAIFHLYIKRFCESPIAYSTSLLFISAILGLFVLFFLKDINFVLSTSYTISLFIGFYITIFSFYLLKFDALTKLFALSWIMTFLLGLLNTLAILGLMPDFFTLNHLHNISLILQTLIYTLILSFKFSVSERSSTELLAIDQARNTFIARISHEVRTPVNGLLGASELLNDSKLSKNQKKQLSIVKLSAEQLYKTISNILDYAALEAEKLHLNRANFKLSNIIYNIQKFHHVTLNIPKDSFLNESYIGDEKRIEQSISNILNTLNTTTNNIPELSICKSFRHKETIISFIISTVNDDNDKIYQKLENILSKDKIINADFDLIISKKLIHLMKGNILIRASKQADTRIEISIPVRKPTIERNFPSLKNSNIKVLLVENNPVNRIILKQQIKQLGYDFDEAENGNTAFELLKKNNYSLVISDYELPDIKGQEISKLINEKYPQLPIIMVCAQIDTVKRKECEQLAIKYCIEKPINIEQLEHIIKKISATKKQLSN